MYTKHIISRSESGNSYHTAVTKDLGEPLYGVMPTTPSTTETSVSILPVVRQRPTFDKVQPIRDDSPKKRITWKAAAVRALAQDRRQRSIAIANRYYASDGGSPSENQKLDSEATSNKNSRLRRLFARFERYRQILASIAYFILVVLYGIIGGAIFFAIEGPVEKHVQKEALSIAHSTRAHLLTNITAIYASEGGCGSVPEAAVHKLANLLELYDISESATNDIMKRWSYPGSIWFAITIFTTIGYGNYAPVSAAGKIFTVGYATIGIPLVLVALGEVGKVFTWLVKKVINKVMRLYIRIRYGADRSQRQGSSARSQISSGRDSRTKHKRPQTPKIYEKDEFYEFDFSPPIAGALVILWLLIVSVITTALNEFNFGTSLYFWFITFTTVGLGDAVPSRISYMTSLLYFPILFIGLSLISMTINTIQERMGKLDDIILEDYLGWEDEDENTNDNNPTDPQQKHPIATAQTDASKVDYHRVLGKQTLDTWLKANKSSLLYCSHSKDGRTVARVPAHIKKELELNQMRKRQRQNASDGQPSTKFRWNRETC